MARRVKIARFRKKRISRERFYVMHHFLDGPLIDSHRCSVRGLRSFGGGVRSNWNEGCFSSLFGEIMKFLKFFQSTIASYLLDIVEKIISIYNLYLRWILLRRRNWIEIKN